MKEFTNKWVFVSGSRRGIGRAIVAAFAKRGANIIAHARQLDAEFQNDMAREATANGVEIRPIFFDMVNTEAMKREVRELLKDIKPAVLINNAAAQHGAFFMMTPVRIIREIFEINLFSQMALTQLLLKPMLARKSGVIVNIASISGINMKPGMSAYGASKAALIAWTKSLAAECGEAGVRVNALAPGLADTDGGAKMEAKARDAMLAGSAMHRLAYPEEIANVACFLASDAASFVNGDVIRVDGGEM